jgi:hypothetical protein
MTGENFLNILLFVSHHSICTSSPTVAIVRVHDGKGVIVFVVIPIFIPIKAGTFRYERLAFISEPSNFVPTRFNGII